MNKIFSIQKIDNYTILYLFGIKITIKNKSTDLTDYEQPPNKSEYQTIFDKYHNKKRFVEEVITFKGYELIVPDVVSFAYQVKEIFCNNIYNFNSSTSSPIIYDCGSNIGLSVLYFKNLYPNSIVKAFEADNKIFNILKENTKNINNIEYYNNAVWINDETLNFNSEGADGGSLMNTFENTQKVQGIRLKTILEKEDRVHFLKIDIEGAETSVIEDCKDVLHKVDNLFIEYHSFIEVSQELDKILLAISNAGFRYYIETVDGCGVEVFINKKTWNNMDLQLNIFCYR